MKLLYTTALMSCPQTVSPELPVTFRVPCPGRAGLSPGPRAGTAAAPTHEPSAFSPRAAPPAGLLLSDPQHGSSVTAWRPARSSLMFGAILRSRYTERKNLNLF